jgi:phosphoribosylglycinamide formyltransferase-1
MAAAHGSLQAVALGVLASGSGTLLDAIIEAQVPIAVVVVDRDCPAISIAQQAGVPVELVERGPLKTLDRLAFTHRVIDALAAHGVDTVAMAGFMTVLDKPMFDTFDGRVLNTHPALLPAFRGAHAVEDAIAYGVKVTGCTIHVATLEVDDGPILAQEPVRVAPGDTVETLHERIKQVERRLYPETIKEFIRQ